MHGREEFQRNTTAGSLRDADNPTGHRPPANDQLVGTIFAEKYRMLTVLGEGGMSMVYKAEHLGLRKVVAIKVLHTHLSGRSNAQQRFQQEAQSASSLSHPGVIDMHDYGVTEDGTPYLVMDFVEGESLGELLERQGYLEPESALQIFGETCAAIADAHEHGVVHRDLKPSNIMLARDRNGETHAKVVDFGVAKVLGEPTQSNPGKLTQTGDFVGSPFYMSPEQCSGKPLDARSDIYSMGCVMYETLTGQVAFGADSIYGTMFKHLNEMPPAISSIRPELGRFTSLEKVILKALAKDPNKRYQSMRELLTDISSLRLGEKAGFFKRVTESFELVFLKGQAGRLAIACCVFLLIGGIIAVVLLSPRTVLMALGECPPASVQMLAASYPKYPPVLTVDTSDAAIELTTDQVSRLGSDLNKMNSRISLAYANGCQCIGMLFLKHGRYDEAITWWEKSIDTFNKCAQPTACPEESDRETRLRASYFDVAECYYRVNNYAKAAKSYDMNRMLDLKLRVERPWLYKQEHYVRATLSEGDCFYRLGHYQQAYALLTDKAVISDIGSGKGLASMEEEQRQLTLAIYHSELADMARREKRYSLAQSEYEAALQCWSPNQPDRIAALFGLASTLQASHQDVRALAIFSQLWEFLKAKPARTIGQNDTVVTGFEQYANLLLEHSSLMQNRSDFFKAIDVYAKAREVKTAV